MPRNYYLDRSLMNLLGHVYAVGATMYVDDPVKSVETTLPPYLFLLYIISYR